MASHNPCLLVARNREHTLFIHSFNIITQIYLVCGCFSCQRGKSWRLYQSIITSPAILSLWNANPVFNATPAFPEYLNAPKSGGETQCAAALGNHPTIIVRGWSILSFRRGVRYRQTKINVCVTCNPTPFYVCFHSAALNRAWISSHQNGIWNHVLSLVLSKALHPCTFGWAVLPCLVSTGRQFSPLTSTTPRHRAGGSGIATFGSFLRLNKLHLHWITAFIAARWQHIYASKWVG